MKHLIRILLCASLMAALVPVGMALADETPAEPCAGDSVAGTVVAVDEDTGVVTVQTDDGTLCTVTVAEGDYDHPIVNLLGRYFDSVDADDLTDALEDTQVWVVCDDEGVCELAEEDDEGAVQGTVTGVSENDDGTYRLEIVVEGEDEPLEVDTDDADLAGDLEDALAALWVDWELDEGEDGPTVVDAADEIAQLHEDGMGFGVIVKLYAMAAASQAECEAEAPDEAEADEEDEPCGVTVDELVEAFQSGTGLGQLFKEYGKPSLLGVGHVRKAAQAEDTDGDGDVDADDDNGAPGGPPAHVCALLNGKNHRNPHCADLEPETSEGGETTGDVPTTDSQIVPGNGGGNGNGNGGNGGGHGNGGGNGIGQGNGGGQGAGNGGGNPGRP